MRTFRKSFRGVIWSVLGFILLCMGVEVIVRGVGNGEVVGWVRL
jgi:small neutral amino acid transporter SnatA (MarC family)